MKHLNLSSLLLFVVCLFLGSTTQLCAQLPQQKKQSKSPSEKITMAVLENKDVALSVDGETMTWGEVIALLPEQTKANLVDDRDNAALAIRAYLRKLVRRACLKSEALRQGYTLTAQDRAKYVADLKKSLASRGSSQSVESYLQQFSQGKSNAWYKMSVSDLMMVAKLTDDATKDVVVTAEDIANEREELKRRDAGSRSKNEELRAIFDELTNDARIETDKWFKQTAKEYSDGTEAVNGGVIREYFTRDELAKELGMTSFNLQKGENTDVLENDDAIRIVRVFDVQPAEQPGGAERVKIGQIVFKKEEMLSNVKDEIIADALLINKRNIAFNEFADNLVKKAQITCPLFPDGLFNNK